MTRELMAKERLKEVNMKKGIILTLSVILATVLLTAGLFGCSPGNSADTNPPAGSPQAAPPQSSPSEVKVSLNNQVEGIWVSGTGKVTVTPDIATLQLGVEAQEASVSEAQTKASEAMDKVMIALTDNGVAEEDIQTQYFRIRQRTRWDEVKQQEVVIGYRVTNQVTASIRDTDKVSRIIDAVVTAGGDYTRINNLNFSMDDSSAYYDEAREEAIADAKDKAEKIASLAGMRLGEPTYISESAVSPVYGGMVYGLSAPMPVPAPAPSISPGEIEISVNMQVAYSIAESE
ncbi:SIMPL domain-containing protein [Chloroflexota bacterium]